MRHLIIADTLREAEGHAYTIPPARDVRLVAMSVDHAITGGLDGCSVTDEISLVPTKGHPRAAELDQLLRRITAKSVTEVR
jgi:hypothetical protein